MAGLTYMLITTQATDFQVGLDWIGWPLRLVAVYTVKSWRSGFRIYSVGFRHIVYLFAVPNRLRKDTLGTTYLLKLYIMTVMHFTAATTAFSTK